MQPLDFARFQGSWTTTLKLVQISAALKRNFDGWECSAHATLARIEHRGWDVMSWRRPVPWLDLRFTGSNLQVASAVPVVGVQTACHLYPGKRLVQSLGSVLSHVALPDLRLRRAATMYTIVRDGTSALIARQCHTSRVPCALPTTTLTRPFLRNLQSTPEVLVPPCLKSHPSPVGGQPTPVCCWL